jgi:methylenetetrahydrofolate dehydrogenase (NADP+)/methenyltetrahydrofolate cyclohydrolase
MVVLYGKPVAERILADTKKRISESSVIPGLAVILIGDDAPSHLYVGLKEKAAQEVGIHFEKFVFSGTADVREIFHCIEEQNARPDIHGIIVQLPLPGGFPTDEIIAHIDSKKDTDGFHQETLKRFLAGDFDACPVFPRAIIELLRSSEQVFHGEKGLVIANSNILGEVMRQALAMEGLSAEYTLSTEPKEAITSEIKEARVIVTACGIPGLVTGKMLQEDAIVIDGGISSADGRVVGDADQESVGKVASFVSPVPGGVGPVTVATLLARVAEAAIKPSL